MRTFTHMYFLALSCVYMCIFIVVYFLDVSLAGVYVQVHTKLPGRCIHVGSHMCFLALSYIKCICTGLDTHMFLIALL